MSELGNGILETEVKNMDEDGFKWLCKQIPSVYLINEVGLRLRKLERCAGEAKESLEKVV